MTKIVRLLHVLSSFSGIATNVDNPIWSLHNKGAFTVKSCYWWRDNSQVNTEL